jgi:predicted nuclease of restriction endonuclease-like (RecB) superfamily
MSRCKIIEERIFYIKLSIKEKYSKRELERQINSGVFERSMSGMHVSPALKDRQSEISSIFKDSYIFEFLNLQESVLETELQKALLIQMKSFVLELGRDFFLFSSVFFRYFSTSL